MDEDKTQLHTKALVGKFIRRLLYGLIPLMILFALVPTKNDLYLILGGSVLLELAEDKDINRVANKSVQAVENWLEGNHNE